MPMIFDFLKPGMYIKRWIFLMLFSIILISASLAKSIDIFNVSVELRFSFRIGLFVLGIGVF